MYRCLVIMPFRPEFDPVFATIRSALEPGVSTPDSESAAPLRIEVLSLKDFHHAGPITDDIVSELDRSTICIADLTGTSPNVMWETGFAMANGKPVILIGQNMDELPFDLKVYRFIQYSPGDLETLAQSVREAVRQTLNRCDIRPAFQAPAPPDVGRTCAVTGSMRPCRGTTAARVARVLSPHLSPETTWLCGSNGAADAAALRFLLAKGQRVYVVGYDAFDISTEIRDLVESTRTPFVDASVERYPKGMTGPTPRDVLFCIRADVVLLLWDGASGGTGALIDYYLAQEKDIRIGFI